MHSSLASWPFGNFLVFYLFPCMPTKNISHHKKNLGKIGSCVAAASGLKQDGVSACNILSFIPQNKISPQQRGRIRAKWGLGVGRIELPATHLRLALPLPYFFHCILPAEKPIFLAKCHISFFKTHSFPFNLSW